MRIVAISGDGIGAGKTYLAKSIGGLAMSLAGQLRLDLKEMYPKYDWNNTTQAYKDHTLVPECDNKTVRQVMVEYGQGKCAEDPGYWAKRLVARIDGWANAGVESITIDDVRKLIEVETLKAAFPGKVLHIHVVNIEARYEPQYQNESLKVVADYVVRRNN